MARSNRSRKLGGILDGLLRKWEKGSVAKAGAVKEAWNSAAEEDIKAHARPVSLKRGVLMVLTDSSAWLYKLTLDKRNILERFNKAYTGRKKVKDIRIRIGDLRDYT